MFPAAVFIVFGEYAKDIWIVWGVYQQYFASDCIYTTVFTKYFDIRRYLRNGLIFIPEISAEATHHPFASGGRK